MGRRKMPNCGKLIATLLAGASFLLVGCGSSDPTATPGVPTSIPGQTTDTTPTSPSTVPTASSQPFTHLATETLSDSTGDSLTVDYSDQPPLVGSVPQDAFQACFPQASNAVDSTTDVSVPVQAVITWKTSFPLSWYVDIKSDLHPAFSDTTNAFTPTENEGTEIAWELDGQWSCGGDGQPALQNVTGNSSRTVNLVIIATLLGPTTPTFTSAEKMSWELFPGSEGTKGFYSTAGLSNDTWTGPNLANCQNLGDRIGLFEPPPYTLPTYIERGSPTSTTCSATSGPWVTGLP